MPARSPRAATAKAVPPLPASLAQLCAAVRENPFLLNDWAKDCPPEALLAGVLNEAVMWGAVPASQQLTVQAAAQMISAVGAGVRGPELTEQPAVKAWLEQAREDGSRNDLAALRKLAAGEVVFEARKRVMQCEALLGEFAPELHPVDERLSSAVRALQERARKLPEDLRASGAGDAEGRAWLEARMSAAYLAGDEQLSAALRAALQALRPRD